MSGALLLALAAVALAFFLLAIADLRRRRPLRAGANALLGLLGAAFALLAAAVLVHLHTYQRLTQERPVAELTFEAIAPGRFRVYFMDRQTNAVHRYELLGDEWQLDARLLKWKGPALLLGLDTLYRLERIGGRYSDLESERRKPRSIYALSANAGLDLWTLSRRHERWLPWVDATYGSAAYLPMADGARFEVRISASGLIARALNGAAEQAVGQWGD